MCPPRETKDLASAPLQPAQMATLDAGSFNELVNFGQDQGVPKSH
jgi:hypothetical protein